MIDESQFVSEITDMKDMLYRLSVSYLHRDADAQDAVQQALENAWRHRARIDVQGFRPWMTRIVINECKSMLRRRKWCFPSGQAETLGGQIPPPDVTLADALERMPEKLRTPLLLHYMEDFTVQEIALALGVPRTTVVNRLHRARRALREALDEREESSCATRK